MLARPVWVDLQLCKFMKTLQYNTKNEASDHALAKSLLTSHRDACPQAGAYGAVVVKHLKLPALHSYINAALRESRYLDASVRLAVENAAHPADQPGAAARNCPLCADGLDLSKAPVADHYRDVLPEVGDAQPAANDASLTAASRLTVVRNVCSSSCCSCACALAPPAVKS